MDVGNESTIQRQSIQGSLGSPLTLLISSSQYDYQFALRTISQLFQEKCSWRYLVSENDNEWEESDISRVGMLPPLNLPRSQRDFTCEDALTNLFVMAEASDEEKTTVLRALEVMGYHHLEGQLWYLANQRIKLVLQLAVFSIRFEVIFCFLDRINFLSALEINQIFEAIRTVCGTFQVSILPVASKAARDFPSIRFMNLIEIMDLEVRLENAN